MQGAYAVFRGARNFSRKLLEASVAVSQQAAVERSHPDLAKAILHEARHSGCGVTQRGQPVAFIETAEAPGGRVATEYTVIGNLIDACPKGAVPFLEHPVNVSEAQPGFRPDA